MLCFWGDCIADDWFTQRDVAKKKRGGGFRSLAGQTHTLQWQQANPLLPTRQQAPSSHAVKYVDNHMNLPIPKQARFSTTSKFISAL